MDDPGLPDKAAALEGLAAIAVTVAEMGGKEEDIVASVGATMLSLGMGTADEVRAVATALAALPQPLDESAEVRERRRPIEQMLGVTSPEDQLIAALRAREALERFADQIDGRTDERAGPE